jgi:hypothetical protein
VAHPQIAAFARLANGNQKALRKLEGQKTMLGRTMHGIAYDAVHDEIYVPQPFAQTILVFRGDSSGEEAPVRYIQGSLTQLDFLDKLEVDPVHNEIVIPSKNKVLVFSRTANGNVAPLRVMRMPKEINALDAVAVDYVNNVIAVSSDPYNYSRGKMPKIVLLNRTDNGQVTPKGIISGPKTMLTGTFGMRAYSPKGTILVCMNGPVTVGPWEGAFVGAWSVNDNGDVPPRWTIGGPNQYLRQPRGVDFDIKNKSVVVSDKVLNSVLTFYYPEIF